MKYSRQLSWEARLAQAWADLVVERGGDPGPALEEASRALAVAAERLAEAAQAARRPEEPDELERITLLAPGGPERMEVEEDALEDRILGALLGRCAGCVLGVPVEGWTSERIVDFARQQGMGVPMNGYWKYVPGANEIHYIEPREVFRRGSIDHVGPDDDLAYTALGLLILEERGLDFTPQDVGEMWLKYLPMACTAEHAALENLRKGLKPPQTALVDNPYSEWIGASIRADAWGYAAAGLPRLAAEMAWRDARVSHTANGIYGEMFSAAAIAAALATSDVEQIISAGLAWIPRGSRLARTVRDTVSWVKRDRDWRKTAERIARRFEGMSGAHIFNNTAITVAALLYGEGELAPTISIAVAMGIDTDCNGATAGSIVGATLGARRLPRRWVEPFGDRLTTYLKGKRTFRISSMARRFARIARKARARARRGAA